MAKSEVRNKKLGLGQWLQPLIGDDHALVPLRVNKTTNPDWVRVPDAKDKFSRLAQAFYERRYPDCEVVFGAKHRENVRFCCDKALDVYFRVQASGTNWPSDTLVIANIYDVYANESVDPLLELFDFVIMVQEEVGYFNLGFEFPGEREAPLIKYFGFKEVADMDGGWSISIAALKERIDAGPIRR